MGAPLSPLCTPLLLKALKHFVLLLILSFPSPELVLEPVPKEAISQRQKNM